MIIATGGCAGGARRAPPPLKAAEPLTTRAAPQREATPLAQRGVDLGAAKPVQPTGGSARPADPAPRTPPVSEQGPSPLADTLGLPPVMPFAEAVRFAANTLLSGAKLAGPAGMKHMLVIDPLIDGRSGAQSIATEAMGSLLGQMIKTTFADRFDLQPFNVATVPRNPLLLIGTLTAVDKEMETVGPRAIYRIWLTLADLKTGKIVAKGFARSSLDGVDATPLAAFRDSPAWSPDVATDGYIQTCQGTNVGDPINPAYWDQLVAAALVNDGVSAYNAGRYEEALDIYRGASRIAAGDQLRVHNGIYLSSWRLGRKEEATQAFARIIDFGLAQQRLGIKFLFQPGSTQFFTDPYVSVAYPIWLNQLAQRAAHRGSCIEISGHTSHTGSAPFNDRLSRLRAQHIKMRLAADAPALASRLTTTGKGWQENIVGLGTDDARDALDRRVEFRVTGC